MRSRQEEDKMILDSDPLIFKQGFIIQKDALHSRPKPEIELDSRDGDIKVR